METNIIKPTKIKPTSRISSKISSIKLLFFLLFINPSAFGVTEILQLVDAEDAKEFIFSKTRNIRIDDILDSSGFSGRTSGSNGLMSGEHGSSFEKELSTVR